MSRATRAIAITSRLILLGLFTSFVGCNKTSKPSYQVFASPDDAGNGLLAAAKSGDPNTILAVFGPDSKDIVLSGDPVQDRNTASLFAAAYGMMHRWRKMPDDSQILLIGADNFAFPIPLKKKAPGHWYFDEPAGERRFWPAALAGTNWRSSTFAELWPTLRPNISHSITEAPSNTPKSSSVTLASRTACIGSHNKISLEVRSGR